MHCLQLPSSHAEHPVVDVDQSINHVPTPPPLDDTRHEILKCMYALQVKEREIFREWLELRSRWNRSLAITQLPNQNLFRIFVYCSNQPQGPDEEDDEDYVEDNGDWPMLGLAKTAWTRLMLVCRRWRDVALAAPALWRAIDIGQTSKWMMLALAPFGDATIDVLFPRDFEEEHASLLQPHCHRLRFLRLRTWSTHALPILHSPLPALETLEMYNNPNGLPGLNGQRDMDISHERYPSLRSLRLVETVIPRDPSVYAPLRMLTLVMCKLEASLEQFVELLTGCSNLEYLELIDFLQRLSGGENVSPRPLRRPHPSLTSVVLRDHDLTDSTQFLSQIVIPAAALAALSMYGASSPRETVRASVPADFVSTLSRLATVRWARATIVSGDWTTKGHPTEPGLGETPLVLLGLASRCALWVDHESGLFG